MIKNSRFWLVSGIYLGLLIDNHLLSYIGGANSYFSDIVQRIIFELIIYVGYIAFAYYVYIKYKRHYVKCDNYKDYYSLLLYNVKGKFWSIKNPKNWSVTFAMIGYILIFLMPFLKFIDSIEWILFIFASELFDKYYMMKNSGLFIGTRFVVLFVLGIIACYLWVYREYRVNKKLSDKTKNKYTYIYNI